MDAYEAILTRRSIRNYIDKPISKDLIKELLEAGMSAPSAGNQQPWHFIVVTEKECLDALAEGHPHGKMLKQAKLAIIVCGDPDSEKHKGFWVQDCSAAIENILLAAHAKGLAGVWVGVYPREERVKIVRDIMKIPDNIIPLAILSIGYSNEKGWKVNRYDESKVHYNRW